MQHAKRRATRLEKPVGVIRSARNFFGEYVSKFDSTRNYREDYPLYSHRLHSLGGARLTMQAAYYDKNGAADEVLRVSEIDIPRAGSGEVLIRLRSSGVNPSDVKNRAGVTRKMTYARVIPHSDGAGVIEAVGEGVDKKRMGERVWIWNGQWKRPDGTAAEFIAVPERQAVRLPDNISFEVGACLGIPAMTAFHAIELSQITKGSRLLVSGGAGAVGSYAIQFAKAKGATVLTTVSSPEKEKIALAAGADHIIDYKHENVAARVADLTSKAGVDAVIEVDLAVNSHLISTVLAPKGRVIVYGVSKTEAQLPAFFCLSNSVTLQFMLVYELDECSRDIAIAGITRMLEEDRLVHHIARVLSLKDIATAHRAVEGGTTGNIVLAVG